RAILRNLPLTRAGRDVGQWPVRLPMTALLMSGLLAACAVCAGEPDWSVRVTPFDQVFPALELSQARRDGAAPAGRRKFAFGDGSGLVAGRVRSRRAGERG